MTTLAHTPSFDLPRIALARKPRVADRPGVTATAARPRRAFAIVLMGLGALLVITALYAASVAFTEPGYTIVAQTLVEEDGALLTVYDGRY